MSDWNRHINTKKHIGNQMETAETIKNDNGANTYTCNCGKSYTNRSGLWKHKKACKYLDNTNLNENSVLDTNIILQLLKQNDEFKNLLLEQNKAVLDNTNKVFETQSQMIELIKLFK